MLWLPFVASAVLAPLLYGMVPSIVDISGLGAVFFCDRVIYWCVVHHVGSSIRFPDLLTGRRYGPGRAGPSVVENLRNRAGPGRADTLE